MTHFRCSHCLHPCDYKLEEYYSPQGHGFDPVSVCCAEPIVNPKNLQPVLTVAEAKELEGTQDE